MSKGKFSILAAALFITQQVNTANATGYFKQATPAHIDHFTHADPIKLCQQSKQTLKYLSQDPQYDPVAIATGSLFLQSSHIDLKRVKQTLEHFCNLADEYEQTGVNKLASNEYLASTFSFYRWYPDLDTVAKHIKKSNKPGQINMLSKLPQDKILLTKYYTKLLSASKRPIGEHQYALYQLPYDEQGLSLTEAEIQADKLTRYRFTRQQVMKGVLNKLNLAKPLVWLSESALHDVLLQGTGVLKLNGDVQYYNVHRNNGIAYDYTKDKTQQARYWYFKQVPSIMGYGKEQQTKIPLTPQYAFAGNIPDLGLGKIFLLTFSQNSQTQARMGVLADSGGAFHNNRFQLDLLVDSYKGWQDYHAENKHLPDYVNAWMMLVN